MMHKKNNFCIFSFHFEIEPLLELFQLEHSMTVFPHEKLRAIMLSRLEKVLRAVRKSFMCKQFGEKNFQLHN